MPEKPAAENPLPEKPVPVPNEAPRLLPERRAIGKVGMLPENIAGALAYVTFVPALLFLFLNPFRKNRFVRFHALQCLLCWGAIFVLIIALKLAGDAVFLIPTAGPLFVGIIDVLAALAAVFVWLVLLAKAIQGERFRLPLLGDFAEQHSGDSASS